MRIVLLALASWITTPALAAEVVWGGAFVPTWTASDEAALESALLASIEEAGHDPCGGTCLEARLRGREQQVLDAALLPAGQRRLDEGRVLYQQAMVPDALAVLADAVATLEAVGPWVSSTAPLWDAWMLTATARATAGDDEGAAAALEAAIALAPYRRPDPAIYPPGIVATWAERAEAVRAARAMVRLVPSDGVLTSAWLDGGPLEAAAPFWWLPGDHALRGRTADGRVGVRRVSTASVEGDVVALDLGAPRLPPADAGQLAARAGMGALIRAVARATATDLVLVVGDAGEGPQPVLYDAVRDLFLAGDLVVGEATMGMATTVLLGRLEEGRIPTPLGTATPPPMRREASPWLARRLLAPVAPTPAAVPAPSPAPIAPVAPVVAETPPAKPTRWPLWVGVGVGGGVAVAAVATTLAVVLSPGAEGPTPVGTITIGPPP